MKTMTYTKGKNRFLSGLAFLSYSLEAFGVIGFEFLLAYAIEFNVYGYDFGSFNMWQSILHWTMTMIVWILGGLYVIKECARKSGVDFVKNCREKSFISGAKELSFGRWILLISGTVISLIASWIDWDGSKVLREFRSRGIILFTFQYLYYFVEVFLVLLVIVFGQYAFEKWFKNDKIPYGGIVVALTWGLGHWIAKGSLATGIYIAIEGFVFGGAYLLTERNLKLSYLFLCIMFIL